DIVASATRREELLLTDEELEVSRTLRRQLSNATPVDAMNSLITEMKRSKNNEEFVQQLAGRMNS
ncbi:MAG: transcription termination factor Rho, partial [Gemmatimonadota bacterium]|nr:transcription termination factor Rho [Gemmatimonadota bacterium]